MWLFMNERISADRNKQFGTMLRKGRAESLIPT